MTPTPPNPAAAAVEKIVRECADAIERDSHRPHWEGGVTGMDAAEAYELIHRAVREAIAASGAREALAGVPPCDVSQDASFVYKTQGWRWGAWMEQRNQALANLDAVCGKEQK